MPGNAILEVKDNNLIDTIRGFLRSLLEKGLLDAMLVPVEVPSRKNVVQTVVTGIDGLDNANPLAPVMPVNSAKIVSSLTKVAPSKKKIGLVLRSCELRALTELVKLKQADLTNLLLIGIDCFGTYSVSDYGTFCQENDSPTEKYLKKVRDGNDSLLRQSCRICCHPVPLTADITIGLIGMDLDREIMVQGSTEAGEEMLKALDLGGDADPSKRDEAVSKLGSEREKQRDEFLKSVQEEVGGLENMLSVLAPCVACHNCRVACPICYCRECLLDSPTFVEWEAEKYLDWAQKKGALRMPADSLLFHLVRLNHMGASCVACGLCEDACPNGISVFKLFCLAGSKVQQAFDYLPGRSLEEELPLTAFKEEEFRDFEK